MPIIEKKIVRFRNDVIPGIDFIEYVDACYQAPFMPFDTGWEVYEVEALKDGASVFDTLTEDQQELVWQLAQQHQARAHEYD